MSDIANLILDGVTAIAAVSVAITANRYAKRQTTLQALSAFSERIAILNHQYLSLGGPSDITPQNAASIERNRELFFVVVSVLDQYETFALAVIERIIDPRIAKRLSGATIRGGFSHFEHLIAHVRMTRGEPQAWEDFEQVARSWNQSSVA